MTDDIDRAIRVVFEDAVRQARRKGELGYYSTLEAVGRRSEYRTVAVPSGFSPVCEPERYRQCFSADGAVIDAPRLLVMINTDVLNAALENRA